MKVLLIFAFLMVWPGLAGSSETHWPVFTEDERLMIEAHGPWTTDAPGDPSNRYSGDESAIALGKALFHFKGLSLDFSQSCATCHQADKAFGDGLARSVGTKTVDRNSIALFNLTRHRWYGWTGTSDTLWGQSIHPIVDPSELNLKPDMLARRIEGTASLASLYRRVFGIPADRQPADQVLVNVGKALAAWQETIVTAPTPFDRFRRQLLAGSDGSATSYRAAAQRGLKLFVGKAKCSFCHFGANFTDGEFHDIGLGFFVEASRVDRGRYGGIQAYQKSPYRRSGPHSDEPAETAKKAPGEFVKLQHRNWGEFRTPSLRNVALTAPYMHNGSLATLEDVVRHYSQLDMERLHADGESLLQPLNLNDREIADLVAFLESLSSPIQHR